MFPPLGAAWVSPPKAICDAWRSNRTVTNDRDLGCSKESIVGLAWLAWLEPVSDIRPFSTVVGRAVRLALQFEPVRDSSSFVGLAVGLADESRGDVVTNDRDRDLGRSKCGGWCG